MDHANRLIHEKSPYLLQHAHNPVDWYPWGPEAFEVARREDKPVFLSIGYSTCRWCHIMEREVFEEADCARVLNEHMVSIKVDREERPDLDRIYMIAVQYLSGSGGWPMSTFLLPDGRPFFGGTYFPPGRFRRIVGQLAESYRERRDEVEKTAAQIALSVAESFTPPETEGRLEHALLSGALARLDQQFDEVNGGFGGAPKFPPHGALGLLFHVCGQAERTTTCEIIKPTLDAMALGGIHDHIGGGFHRYSTDASWFLPHFEKMLYDNALLFRSYVDGYRLSGDPFYRRVADGIYRWLTREMTTAEGAFCSGMDAESEGQEGKFYLWSREGIMAALGREDGDLFCRVYQVTETGNYHEEHGGMGRTGMNILHLRQRLSELAELESIPAGDLETRMAEARSKLLASREQRVRPFTDDKVVVAWNGLAIAGLAYAGRMLGNTAYTDAARRAASFVLAHCRADGRLHRRWREGEVSREAFLDDYAFLTQGLLELYETTAETAWLDQAKPLIDEVLGRFRDDERGDFSFTPGDGEPLFARPKEVLDQPIPASSAVAIQNLLNLAAITGDPELRSAAEGALHAVAPWIARIPQGAESLALALAMYLETAAPVA